MGQIIPVYPDLPSFRESVALGDAQFKLRFTWRDRLAAWYADLWTAAGVPVWLGQRVSTGWALGFGLAAEGAPDGILLVRGPSEYSRMDLGSSVQIVFYPSDELPAATADESLAVTLT